MIIRSTVLKPLRSSRGMTLLEIMLAMLVLGMVVAMVSLSLSGSMKVVDATDRQGELYYRAQVALERISEDLASALLVNGVEFIGKKADLDGSSADTLQFSSAAHVVFDPADDHPGIAYISYNIAQDDESGGELLLRRRDVLLPSDEIKGGGTDEKQGYLLSDRLQSVSFSYIDEEGEEHDSWNTTVDPNDPQAKRKLPVSVICTLGYWLDHDKGTSIKFTTRILIPVGLVNAANNKGN